uniref:Fibronectin type-III domain-containing protein n=1 Tax=Astyanax mexicanus TaxID=7994 RepID=A0A8B9J739_ASTMX
MFWKCKNSVRRSGPRPTRRTLEAQSTRCPVSPPAKSTALELLPSMSMELVTSVTHCNKTSYKITNLEEGMLYYFRVLPENIYGIGEPRETPDAVLVCEVPLPPSKLEVVDVTKSSVSLGWEKPEHDGGSRLTGYIVEACKAGTDKWMKVATLKLTDYEYTIDKLNESEQYLFRVRAVNSRGVGEPKETVTAVTVQEQRGTLQLFS